ncbi:hypothetical protein CHL67_06425 [Prosthecochloris sp. GSB1]|nr:hypothetical protein CHL67_06425 [Prosthecochloris sp. GSB1]
MHHLRPVHFRKQSPDNQRGIPESALRKQFHDQAVLSLITLKILMQIGSNASGAGGNAAERL